MNGQASGPRIKRQHAYIVALLEHPTLQKAAAAVGISDVTLWRCLKQPEFEDAFLNFARNKRLRLFTMKTRYLSLLALRLQLLVAKLGKALDKDPRIFAVQMGLMGYWASITKRCRPPGRGARRRNRSRSI